LVDKTAYAGIMSQDTLKPKRLGIRWAALGIISRPTGPLLILVGDPGHWRNLGAGDSARVDWAGGGLLFDAGGCGCLCNFPGAPEGGAAAGAVSNCTLIPNSELLSQAERLAGLGRVMLMIVGLYLMASLLTGLTFYLMSYAGQHVLRQMRVDLFKQLHRLSLGYYAEHEAGDLMSRITNDSETIQQAFSFALINVLSGLLLIGWIGYNMLRGACHML